MDLLSQLDVLGLDFDPTLTTSLERLVDELIRWNTRRNLTAINDRAEIIEKHLVDSLTLLPFARESKRMLDLGSGAGFPALPIKIACPLLPVVAVDSVGKKIDFHRHIARLLHLVDYNAVASRIETLAEDVDFRNGFDLVTARALSSLEQVVSLAEPFLLPGGRVVAMKGPEGRLEAAEWQSSLLAARWSIRLVELSLPVSRSERCLIELRRTDGL